MGISVTKILQIKSCLPQIFTPIDDIFYKVFAVSINCKIKIFVNYSIFVGSKPTFCPTTFDKKLQQLICVETQFTVYVNLCGDWMYLAA